MPPPRPAVARLIRENGHIFTEAQCKVCSALLISESQRLAHYQVGSGEPPQPPGAGLGGVRSGEAGAFISAFSRARSTPTR